MGHQQLVRIMKITKLQYEVMAQDAYGTAGGLTIIWNPEEVLFENWISFPKILLGMFKLIGSEERILILGVYGLHIPREWKNFLKNMQAIRRILPRTLWIIGGDFNMIRMIGEKKGGLRRPDQNMEEFNEMITEQRLVDTPRTNGVHTWNNRRGGRNKISSRLNRFLLSEQILNRDVFIEAKIMLALGSDHWPIKLELISRKTLVRNLSDSRPFGSETLNSYTK